jgi:hypothetical protein
MNEVTTQNSNLAVQESVESRIAVLKQNIDIVKRMMAEVLKENEHYGIIPGTQRPTLLKPGAEKLLFVFRLGARYNTVTIDRGDGHREYNSDCIIYEISSEKVLGSASGSCSTLESKYRYRNIADFEVLDEEIPKDAKEKKKEYRSQGLGMKQVDGVWRWVRYRDSQRTENPDIADVYNTALKMSQKRALIATTLNVLAVSDMFTQDTEDFLDTPEGRVDKRTGEFVSEPTSNKGQNSQNKNQAANNPNNSTKVKVNSLTPEQSYNSLIEMLDQLKNNKENLKEVELITKLLEIKNSWVNRKHQDPVNTNGLVEINKLLGALGYCPDPQIPQVGAA